MITRIELTNFMAHRHTVIEPAAGLTVLVGPNNVGKSAVVAALQILCQNESSAYVVRHGERESSVSVQTDDGHSAEWRRKGSTQSYVIDGQVFDRLKGRIPEELHQALRLPRVDAEGDADFDVHFGEQKSPIFLLGSSGANAARFFASSSDAIQLVAMQKRHKEKLSAAQREKSRLEADSKTLNEELECLKPVGDIDDQVVVAEQEYGEIVRFAGWLGKAERDQEALDRQNAQVVRHRAFAAALGELAEPPELVDVTPLERLIEAIAQAAGDQEHGKSRAQALRNLAAPPELLKTERLSVLIDALEFAASRHASAASRAKAMQELSSPPQMEAVSPLAALTQELSSLAADIDLHEQEQAVCSRLSSPPLLADTEVLRRIIVRLATSTREQQMATAELSVLASATPIPVLLDEAPIAALVALLAKASSQHNRWQAEFSSLARMTAPPVPTDLEDLARSVVQLGLSAEDVHSCQTNVAAATVELKQTADELRMRAEGSECPICGTILDAETVLARAAVGLGGHAHA